MRLNGTWLSYLVQRNLSSHKKDYNASLLHHYHMYFHSFSTPGNLVREVIKQSWITRSTICSHLLIFDTNADTSHLLIISTTVKWTTRGIRKSTIFAYIVLLKLSTSMHIDWLVLSFCFSFPFPLCVSSVDFLHLQAKNDLDFSSPMYSVVKTAGEWHVKEACH